MTRKNVLCLGCSYTYFSDRPVAETWPYHLWQMLEVSPTPVSVVNAGLRGSSIQSLTERYLYMREMVRPDIVVVQLTHFGRKTIGLDSAGMVGERRGVERLRLSPVRLHEHFAYMETLPVAEGASRIDITPGGALAYVRGEMTDNRLEHAARTACPLLSDDIVRGYMAVYAYAEGGSTVMRLAAYESIILLHHLITAAGQVPVFVFWPDQPFLTDELHDHPITREVEKVGVHDGVMRWMRERMGEDYSRSLIIDEGLHLSSTGNALVAGEMILPLIRPHL